MSSSTKNVLWLFYDNFFFLETISWNSETNDSVIFLRWYGFKINELLFFSSLYLRFYFFIINNSTSFIHIEMLKKSSALFGGFIITLHYLITGSIKHVEQARKVIFQNFTTSPYYNTPKNAVRKRQYIHSIYAEFVNKRTDWDPVDSDWVQPQRL